jgi:hypothetical protein
MAKGYNWVVMNGGEFYPASSISSAKTKADKLATANAEYGRYHKSRVLEAADSGSKPKIIYTGKVNKTYLKR